MSLKLIRDQCGPSGTLGYIDLDDCMPPVRTRIYTLERPWVAALPTKIPSPETTTRSGPWLQPPCGRKGVSCIPPGTYDLVPHSTESHPHTFALVNPELWVYHFDEDMPVWCQGYARTAVLIHPANYIEELRGCIAPGLTRNQIPISAPNIGASRKAFEMLLPFLRAARQIEIIEL